MIYLYLLGFFIMVILIFLSWAMIELGVYYEGKLVSFECGFMSFLGQSGAFSLHFFLISILFLIFDVEIVLILPLPVLLGKLIFEMELLFLFWFMLVVLGGLYFEWYCGSLDWVY